MPGASRRRRTAGRHRRRDRLRVGFRWRQRGLTDGLHRRSGRRVFVNRLSLLGLTGVIQRRPRSHQRRIRRVVEARTGDHSTDVPELADQEALKVARSGRGVQVRSGGHRALDVALQLGQRFSPGRALLVRVEHSRDHLQVNLSGRRVLVRQSYFGISDRVGRIALLVLRADRVVRHRRRFAART